MLIILVLSVFPGLWLRRTKVPEMFPSLRVYDRRQSPRWRRAFGSATAPGWRLETEGQMKSRQVYELKKCRREKKRVGGSSKRRLQLALERQRTAKF
ncbi:hypothetical protein BGZ63DRAFT_392768 [Mariannaea sp. PMI_226]|nr:hypothetical protein BGZ63DRAFT_392768 [Mariannaea sp. PMI_226]